MAHGNGYAENVTNHACLILSECYNTERKEFGKMANAVNVNFRLDEDVKKSMEQTCSELGLSVYII